MPNHNTIQQNQPLNQKYKYQVGGSLPLYALSYVPRQADQDFYEGLKKSEFCYVLNTRQMGKSSLRVRTLQRLQAEGIACANIDITEIGSTDITLEQWYAGMIDRIADTVKLVDFDLDTWWEKHSLLSPVHHFGKFIEDILLEKVQQPIVIFIDEIDAVRQFGEDFFALIRSCYNMRPDKPAYQRLTFAILGVASQADLIQDKKRTPFNLGRAIELSGFQLHEANSLAQGLTANTLNPQAVLQIILDWTGGQPFLTQKLCQLISKTDTPIPVGQETVWIEQLVQNKVINHWETQDEPMHLRHIRDRILHEGGQYSGQLLGLYQKVLQQRECPIDDSRKQIELRLSGLVVRCKDKLLVYNRIYAKVFEKAWVEKALAGLRPYTELFKAWVACGYQDESLLLRGKALQEAQTWADGKNISDEYHKFLAASSEQTLKAQIQANQVKTQRRAILGLILFVGVTAGLAIWGYAAQQQAWENAALAEHQKELAEQQEAIALQQKALALDAINTLTYEFTDELAQMPPRNSPILSRILANNIVLLDKIYVLDLDTKRALREKAINLEHFGDNWLLLGNIEKALETHQRSYEIRKQLVQSEPQSTLAQRDLSVSLDRIGSVQLQLGNSQAAFNAYQQSLKLRQQFAQDDPNNSETQRDLLVSYYKLGTVQESLQKPAAALQLYQKALAMAEKLAAKDILNQTVQNDLIILRNLVEKRSEQTSE